MVHELFCLLSPGDVLIDAGNSHFRDTERLQGEATGHGIGLVGMGISGGDAGARRGAAIMLGGDAELLRRIEPLFKAVAARGDDGDSCCTLVGPGGAGHFVKMMHNGIEYADMQLIAEAAYLMRRLAGMAPRAVAEVFRGWLEGPISSYLLEAATAVLEAVDDADDMPLIDRISDVAAQKGTGQWAVNAALELNVPAPGIAEAVFARTLSACRVERTALRSKPLPAEPVANDKLLTHVHDALLASRAVAFAQGFAVIAAASRLYGCAIDLPTLSRGWTSGCIIRGAILDDVVRAFERQPDVPLLLLDKCFADSIDRRVAGWRSTVTTTVSYALPVPAMAAGLAWRDALAAGRLWTDLVQGRRDYFGAHGFERIDRPGMHRHLWQST